MSIPYTVIRKDLPGEAAGRKKKYYATAVSNNKTDLHGLIDKAKEKCSMNGADLIRAVYLLQDLIADELEKGNIVHIKPLGSFYPSIKSEAKDSPEEVTPKSIKKVSINYRPSRAMRDRIAGASFERVKS